MFDALLLTTALLIPAQPDTFTSGLGATTAASWSARSVEQTTSGTRAASDDADRTLALNRPSRSGTRTVSVVQRAAAFPQSLVPFASCVIRRESGGSLDRRQSGVGARNPASSASGRWQFLDRSWRQGLSFMVRDRLIRFGMPKAQARKVRLYLGERPIWKWHGYWQDIGFLEVVHRGGSFHWRGPGC
jgi:hypothetical protein